MIKNGHFSRYNPRFHQNTTSLWKFQAKRAILRKGTVKNLNRAESGTGRIGLRLSAGLPSALRDRGKRGLHKSKGTIFSKVFTIWQTSFFFIQSYEFPKISLTESFHNTTIPSTHPIVSNETALRKRHKPHFKRITCNVTTRTSQNVTWSPSELDPISLSKSAADQQVLNKRTNFSSPNQTILESRRAHSNQITKKEFERIMRHTFTSAIINIFITLPNLVPWSDVSQQQVLREVVWYESSEIKRYKFIPPSSEEKERRTNRIVGRSARSRLRPNCNCDMAYRFDSSWAFSATAATPQATSDTALRKLFQKIFIIP